MLEPGTSEYERRYTDWTSKGELAYASTRQHLYTLFGGAKGGSKTVTGCRIIQTDISNYEGGLFGVMRRNYTALHETTKRSFERFFPPELVVKKTTNVWYCINDNRILWWAADRTNDPDYEKTRGLELSALMVDEASQLDELFYENAPSLLRLPAKHVETGAPLSGYIYLTSNPVPGNNYLKRIFIAEKTRKRDGRHHFIRSLPDENECAPPGYVESAFSTMTGPLLEMLRYGNWEIEESEFVIVPGYVLEHLKLDSITDRTPVAAGIDIGLGRPDATVVYLCNRAGEFWRETSITDEYDTMRLADRLLPYCLHVQSNGGKVAVDAGSVGKGVADRLNEQLEWGRLMAINFGESAVEEFGVDQQEYENRRAQLYWWARSDAEESVRRHAAGGERSMAVLANDDFTDEIANTYYLPRDGKLKLEPKAEITKRLGHSPDDADAFVLCNAARRELRLLAFTLPSRGARDGAGRRSRRESSITAGY